MSKSRIYKVVIGQTTRLVRAQNIVQARNHVARESIEASLASQDDLVALAGKTAVEDANATATEDLKGGDSE